MAETMVIKTLELPYGQDWLPYPDANVIALAPHLDETARERALCEARAYLRRVDVVSDDQPPAVIRQTQPITLTRRPPSLPTTRLPLQRLTANLSMEPR